VAIASVDMIEEVGCCAIYWQSVTVLSFGWRKNLWPHFEGDVLVSF
jgi:hypothetical protein